ncbi:HAD family phosphatase [bacterium]|nr:HAD family phosphatase [bacterium]
MVRAGADRHLRQRPPDSAAWSAADGRAQMRRYLLWDHDGVLVDTEKWYFRSTRECLAGIGCELDHATYLRFMSSGGSCWDLARQRGVSDEVIARARSERDRLYQHFLCTEPIEIDGVVEVLRQLRDRYEMAIVTDSRREDFELIHRSRCISGFFDFVITIEDCERPKPNPDPYREALRRFGADPGEAVAIEDSSRGLRSAMGAGVDCVIVASAFTASEDFSDAWRVVDDLRELPDLLSA